MHQAVGLGAHGHALDAVAVGGRRAGDVGENVAADGDLALFGLKPHLADPFLSVGEYQRIPAEAGAVWLPFVLLLYSISGEITREKKFSESGGGPL